MCTHLQPAHAMIKHTEIRHYTYYCRIGSIIIILCDIYFYFLRINNRFRRFESHNLYCLLIIHKYTSVIRDQGNTINNNNILNYNTCNNII